MHHVTSYLSYFSGFPHDNTHIGQYTLHIRVHLIVQWNRIRNVFRQYMENRRYMYDNILILDSGKRCVCSFFLEGKNVSTLTHTHRYKPRRIIINLAITSLTTQFTFGLMFVLVICYSMEKKCVHTWHQISLLRSGLVKNPKKKLISEIKKCAK